MTPSHSKCPSAQEPDLVITTYFSDGSRAIRVFKRERTFKLLTREFPLPGWSTRAPIKVIYRGGTQCPKRR